MQIFADKLGFLLLLILLLPFVSCQKQTVQKKAAVAMAVIHVSPEGDDSGDGSDGSPLKTLEAARQRIRQLGATTGSRWARVELDYRFYRLEKPFVLTPEDSGDSPNHPITYAGGGVIGGTWIEGFRHEGKQWVAKVPDSVAPFRDLWVNGRRAIRARSPNNGFFRVQQAGPDNHSSFSIEPADLLSLAQPRNAEVVFMHDWSCSRVRLASIDAASHSYQFANPIGADDTIFRISNFEPNPRYYIENAIELLDTPGEWFLDEDKHELHYLPREGEAMKTAQVIAPVVDQLVVLRGEGDKYVENVRFEGVTFAYSRFDLPAHGFAELQANWYYSRDKSDQQIRVMSPAAVMLDRARGCSFTDCRFEHLSACGLHLAHTQQTGVDRTAFSDLGGNGIMIGSLRDDEVPAAEHNSIKNCTIDRCGQTYFGAVGVWVGMSVETTVQNNEISDLPYTGISVGWCWDDSPTICRGHHIRENNIHHVMQLLSDGGGIYTLGRQPGTVLAGNVIHDIAVNAGRAESNGIFMDQGSNEILVENNTIYRLPRSPIRFNEAGKNTFVGNRLAVAAGIPAFAYRETKAENQIFTNNEEITTAEWQPPADDGRVKAAGPQP